MDKIYISKTIKDTHTIAQNIIKEMVNLETFVNQSKLIVLKGDLGVGKTEFVKGLAKFLKVKNNVLSPTFVLSKVYDVDFEGTKKLYHLDLYRLIQNNKVDGSFLEELCLEEKLIDKTNLIVIEWGDKIEKLLKVHYVLIDFSIKDGQRIVKVKVK